MADTASSIPESSASGIPESAAPTSGPLFSRVVIFGVGLLGGSLGKAIIDQQLASEVIGTTRNKASIEDAKRLDLITSGTTDMAEALAGADLVVLCTPVLKICELLPQIIAAADPGCIVTDVGSTKRRIVEIGDAATAAQGGVVHFVGGHPMAGSEQSGMKYARADLFKSRSVYLTPTKNTNQQAVGRLSALWRALECRLLLCRPERHDDIVSLTSHLPFLGATALVQTMASTHEDRNLLGSAIAGGFRDSTRVAAGNSEMWRDILTTNLDQVLSRAQALQASLTEIIHQLELAQQNPESLKAFLADQSRYRSWFDEA
jgi:prephenate dehydrogenase